MESNCKGHNPSYCWTKVTEHGYWPSTATDTEPRQLQSHGSQPMFLSRWRWDQKEKDVNLRYIEWAIYIRTLHTVARITSATHKQKPWSILCNFWNLKSHNQSTLKILAFETFSYKSCIYHNHFFPSNISYTESVKKGHDFRGTVYVKIILVIFWLEIRISEPMFIVFTTKTLFVICLTYFKYSLNNQKLFTEHFSFWKYMSRL